MTLSTSLHSALKRICLGAALALLAGCAMTPERAAVEVSSPPPPSSGTQRIVAYDAYAATLFGPVRTMTPPAADVAATDADDKHAITSTLD